MRDMAAQRFGEVMAVLRALPRPMLLVFRNINTVRSINAALGAPVDRYSIMAKRLGGGDHKGGKGGASKWGGWGKRTPNCGKGSPNLWGWDKGSPNRGRGSPNPDWRAPNLGGWDKGSPNPGRGTQNLWGWDVGPQSLEGGPQICEGGIRGPKSWKGDPKDGLGGPQSYGGVGEGEPKSWKGEPKS